MYYTQKKPIENTHIVRERDRQRNRELLAVLFLGVPIGFFLLLFTWQNLEVIRLGREATRLQKTLKDTEAAHKSLEAELDRLTSFETVETQATQLGFEPTDPKKIVMVEENRAEGLGPRAEGPPTPGAPISDSSSLGPQPSALGPSSGPRPSALGPSSGGR
ncbi:MAG TPA: hypothetical protein VEK57_27325 [Thermoanaerobaculia bacterium]|nr:hypothetical protein [Thermoanaerobaculia bacterium]